MKRFCILAIAASTAAAMVAACGGDSDPIFACTDIAVPGLSVTVVDSASGDTLPPPSVVVAKDGAYADTAGSINAPHYSLVYERKGTYVVTVTHAGYSSWHRSGVVVTADRCHVQTVQLTAKLQP